MKYLTSLILMLSVLLFIPQVSVADELENNAAKQYLGVTTKAYIADEFLNLVNISQYMRQENLVTSNSIMVGIGSDGAIKINHTEGEADYVLEISINAVNEKQYGVMWEVIKKTKSEEKIYGSSDKEYQLQPIGKPMVFSIELDGNQMIFDLTTRVDRDTNLIKFFKESR